MFDSDEVIIFHNPKCSKSRQTLSLLQQRGIEPTVIEYLRSPLSRAELEELLRRLNCEPRQLMRTGEAVYKARQLDSAQLDSDTLIQAIVDHPVLMQRPVVVCQGKAAIGRPPEAVLAVLA